MLSIDQQRILGRLLARLSTGLTDRYLCLEAAGLKHQSEQLTRTGRADHLTALWERSPDGYTWEPWMRISFTKLG